MFYSGQGNDLVLHYFASFGKTNLRDDAEENEDCFCPIQKGLQNQVDISELALIQHSTSSSTRKAAAAGLTDKFYLPRVLELWTRFLLCVKVIER